VQSAFFPKQSRTKKITYEPRTDELLVHADGAHCGEEILYDIQLSDIAPAPRAEGLSDHLRRVVLTYEKDLGPRSNGANVASRGEAIEGGQTDVEQHDIGLQFSRPMNGAFAIGHVADDLDVRLLLEQSAKLTPHYFVVLYDQNPNSGGAGKDTTRNMHKHGRNNR
jgi:hypothetical protein